MQLCTVKQDFLIAAMTTLLTAASLLLENSLLADPVVILEDGVIRSIAGRAEAALPRADVHHDYPGATLAPALFDVHTHGCQGHDVMEATPAALTTIGRFLANHGVGAYLPTTISAPRDRTLRSLEGLAAWLAQEPQPGHARALGIHIEGPFLSHAKRGTHAVRDLVEPSIPLFDEMFAAAQGRVVLMTIAPELPGALDLIDHAMAQGVRVSIGHSNARTAEARAAVAHGAVSATHTFNAMRALDQRDPGILGTVLTDDTLYAEFICDGMHTDPSIAGLFARAKGPERAILVTDAMSATGMPDGMYKLGDLDVRVVSGRATTGEDTLAGSTLTLDRAVRNYASFAELPVGTALRAATGNPAAMIGVTGEAGTLTQGGRADVSVFSPQGDLLATYLGGARA
jgi:N-acetylglucosamine-6-phosphate deacetylase